MLVIVMIRLAAATYKVRLCVGEVPQCGQVVLEQFGILGVELLGDGLEAAGLDQFFFVMQTGRQH